MNFNRKDDVQAKKIADRFRVPFTEVIKNALDFYLKSLELKEEGFEVQGVKEQITTIQFRKIA